MATKEENLRMQRVRWYRTRPLHLPGCDFIGCGGCAPRPPTEADVKIHDLWRHYLNGRVVRVVGRFQNVVLILALAPPKHSRGHGKMVPRTNTAPISIDSFLAQYFPAGEVNGHS